MSLASQYTVSLLCQVAHVSRSGYYRWLTHGVSTNDQTLEIVSFEQIHYGGILGYRSMKRLLKDKYGIVIGGSSLRLLMEKHNLQAVIRRKRRKHQLNSVKQAPIAPNLLNREFHSPAPGQKYVTDITYIPIPNSMAYLSVIIDLFNGEVVSYKLSQLADASLSVDVLRDLASKRNLAGALLHSDQGVHYTNKEFQNLVKETGLIPSMSRKGNCWDNAMVENFFSHFKCECVRIRKRSFKSFLAVVEVVDEYLNYYNNERTQERLKGLAPVAFRQQAA